VNLLSPGEAILGNVQVFLVLWMARICCDQFLGYAQLFSVMKSRGFEVSRSTCGIAQLLVGRAEISLPFEVVRCRLGEGQ
jgi:hypothetical protein